MPIVLQIIDNSILCGYRGEAEQNYAFDNNLSQVRFPDSKHNSRPSMAIDAAPYDQYMRNVDYNDIQRLTFFAGIVIGVAERLFAEGGVSHKVRWGGDWDRDTEIKDEKFRDLVHFELVKP